MRVRAACLGLLAAGVCFTAVALASSDESVTTNEPQPGGTLSGSSQSIGSSKGATMSVTGDLRDTTVVVEGGVRQTQKFSEAAGNAVAACWLAGPQAIQVNHEKIRDWLATDVQELAAENTNPQDMLSFCVALVTFVAERLVDSPSARTAAGCRATPVNLRLRRRNGRTVLTQAKRRQGPSTRYTCKKVSGGIAMTARDRKGRSLKRALGSKLDYGLYKTTDGPASDGKLRLRFQLR